MGLAVRPLLLGIAGLLVLGWGLRLADPKAPDPVLPAFAKAQGVPWTAGERLNFSLAWQGIVVGELKFHAEPTPEGWRYRGKLEPQGLGVLLGYGLEAESEVGSNLYTSQFKKDLIEPGKGTTRLESEVGDYGTRTVVTNPDGKRSGWRNPSQDVLDDLSILYFLRARPEMRQVNVVDYPRLAQGKVENLGKNGEGLSGYRFAQDNLNIEMWFRPDVKRTPARMYITRDFGRLEGNLIENRQ